MYKSSTGKALKVGCSVEFLTILHNLTLLQVYRLISAIIFDMKRRAAMPAILGGMIAAVQKGYIQKMLKESAQEKQREVERGDRLIVGVNELVIPPEEDFQIPIQELKVEDSEEIATRMEEWKKTRNTVLLQKNMAQLYSDAKQEDRYNLMPSIIEAVKAYATAGEIIGVIRTARGLCYDPLETIDCPFDFD